MRAATGDAHLAAPHDGDRHALGRYQSARRAAIALLLGLLFAIFLFVASALPEEQHEWVEAAGLGLIVIGICGRLWSTLYVGGRKASEIIDTGPYSITRNPLYLFSSVAAAGVGAQIGSVTTTVIFALLCVLAFHVVILREERFLRIAFGAPYEAYLQRVPRFLPNPSLYRDEALVSFKPSRLKQTLLDGLIFFIAYPLFEIVEIAQRNGTLPVLLHLP